MATTQAGRGGRKTGPSPAPGDRVYAIGDIHGRYDLMRDLLRRIEEHNNALPAPRTLHIVLLGDVIDRGPDSAKVLAFLHDWAANTRGQIMLLGNHEEMMLRVYDGETRLLRPWMGTGGRETVQSFGLEPPSRDGDERAYVEAMRQAIPRDLIEFVRGWPLSARSGDYYFCHAGVRPGVALKAQKRTDLIWIRDEFLGFTGDHGATIVHGHSISPSVDLQANRIGIDTGAYRTGVLTAVYLEGGERDFLATETPAMATA